MVAILPLLLSILAVVQGFSLPKLTGPYFVGTAIVELNDASTSRDLMVSVFYPTDSNTNYTVAPAFLPKTAAYLSEYVGLPTGALSTVMSQAYLNAMLLDGEFPVLIFSPGLSGPRIIYNSIAEDLASEGYIVITVDHPYESLVIEYPDGRLDINPQINPANETEGYQLPLLLNRTLDISFVLDQVQKPSNLTKIPGFSSKCLQTRVAGVLGHSFGGASAAAVMLNDSRFIAGADLDGVFWGPVAESGLSKPFIMMRSAMFENTTWPSWVSFLNNSEGYKRVFTIDGTVHEDFTDQPYLVQGFGGPPFSEINPVRMFQIVSAYLKSFFDEFLNGGELIRAPNSCYQDVTFAEEYGGISVYN